MQHTRNAVVLTLEVDVTSSLVIGTRGYRMIYTGVLALTAPFRLSALTLDYHVPVACIQRVSQAEAQSVIVSIVLYIKSTKAFVHPFPAANLRPLLLCRSRI